MTDEAGSLSSDEDRHSVVVEYQPTTSAVSDVSWSFVILCSVASSGMYHDHACITLRCLQVF